MGVIHSTKIQTGPTGKSGPPQKVDHFFKTFPVDRTNPLSFGPKFPEILVEWIAPNNFLQRPREYNTSIYHTIFSSLCLFLLPHEATDIPKKAFPFTVRKWSRSAPKQKMQDCVFLTA